MKNLELKIRIFNLEKFKKLLKNYFKEILIQKDTYFITKKGRLKLREENDKCPCIIKYYRPNIASNKLSIYYIQPILNVETFYKIFGEFLQIELVVNKKRLFYLYKNAKIHLDEVDGLGTFLEIEVVISNEDEEKNSQSLMKELVNLMNISQYEKLKYGYRELTKQNYEKKWWDT